jgi:Gpi18-like mannosyltransferase
MVKTICNPKNFILWGLLCVAANLILTFALPYDGDQSFWVGWIGQLQEGGFGNFQGNYPPLYVFWLWIVGKVHLLFGIGVDKTFFLKFMCLWPVYFAHLALVQIVYGVIKNRKLPDWLRHVILGFTALNPALLAGGAIWGQVDLVPLIFVVCSILLITNPKYIMWASLFYVLSLLAKFQMIMFLPVFGGLFLRHYRVSWKGLPIALIGVLLVLFPYFLGNNLGNTLSNAYVNSTSQYPYSTFNAANLWMLLQGNAVPENLSFLGNSNSGLGFLLAPKWLGKILFTIFSVFVLVAALRCHGPRRAFQLATWNAFAFFVLLPGMHERYLLYVVPPALLWFAYAPRRGWVWAVTVSLLASINILLINGIKGDALWPYLSFLVLLAFLFSCIPLFSNRVWLWMIAKIQKVPSWKGLPYGTLTLILLAMLGYLGYSMRPSSVTLEDNQILLYHCKTISLKQGFKTPQIGFSVDGKNLSVGGRQFLTGIGSHAPSSLVFEVPPLAETLSIGVGVDDEAEQGNVIFRIFVDEKMVWESRPVRGGKTAQFVSVSLQEAKLLRLETDTNGPDFYDHADWLNPVITLRKHSQKP